MPVTLLAGFLGAGKTTLLQRILSDPEGPRVAVIVNEFGEVGIDGRLVVRAEEEIVELANGCVCCNVRGDLARSASRLLSAQKRRPFERLIVEASGLASPGPVLQTFELEPDLAARTRRDGVVTLVHTAEILGQIERHPEVLEQLGYADLVLLNHIDQTTPDRVQEVRARCAELNPLADVRSCERADVPTRDLFGIGTGRSRMVPLGPGGEVAAVRHTEGATSHVLRSDVALELHALKMWLQFLAAKRGHELWRVKGILRCSGRTEAAAVQGVYQWLELGPAPEAPPAESVLVLIGKDLDVAELERGWRACQAASD